MKTILALCLSLNLIVNSDLIDILSQDFMEFKKTAAEEAEWILNLTQGSIKDAFTLLSQHFMTIQSRNQLLLTLSTVTLTITGFSGPRIAESGPVSLVLLVMGLIFILLATVMLLGTGMRLRWVTQFDGKDPQDIITQVIAYRNQKAEIYQWQLRAIIIGLCCYVGSLVSFFLS